MYDNRKILQYLSHTIKNTAMPRIVTTYLLRPLDGDWIKNLICKTRDKYIRDIAHLKLAGIQI